MGEGKKEMGIPQLLQFNTLLILGALFIGIIASQALSSNYGSNSFAITLFILALALGLLVVSADFFIEGAKGLAIRGGIPEVVIGLTIVSIGTSLPEILVTSTAAMDSSSNPEIADFAIGGILGSILVQITLILGIVALSRGLEIRPSWLRRDGQVMMLSILLLSLFLLTDYSLSRLEGIFLSFSYLFYITWLLYNRKVIQKEEDDSNVNDLKGISWTGTAYFVMILIGLSLAVFAAHHLVNYASDIAYKLNVPHSVIGTTVSGLGTSLPELTIALMAARKSQGVAIGTLIGSNITDPLLSIGSAAIISPLTITPEGVNMIIYFILPSTVISTLAALMLMRTSYKFQRWEGLLLISLYLVFLMICEYLRRTGF